MKAGMGDHRGRVCGDEVEVRHAFHRGLLPLNPRQHRGCSTTTARNGSARAGPRPRLALPTSSRSNPMSYAISGLPIETFRPLFGLSNDELAARGIVRQTAGPEGRYPCRVTLEDAQPGQSLLLLNYEHQDAATPY